jgi:hypothetical protein
MGAPFGNRNNPYGNPGNRGNPNPSGRPPPPGPGRPPGSVNKIGKQAKENIIEVFNQLGGVEAMTKWARRNKGEFYRLYARLIPVVVHGSVDVRHASEFSDDELARIVASGSGTRVAGEETREPTPGSVH